LRQKEAVDYIKRFGAGGLPARRIAIRYGAEGVFCLTAL